MPARPPFLIAAIFCERPLFEQDGVISVIRIFDRIFVPRVPHPAEAAIPLTLVLMFKGGGYKGKAKITILPRPPSNAERPKSEQEIQLPEQANAGANLIATIPFTPNEEGVYWFEVFVNDELVTRTPLDVQVLPSQTQTKQSPTDSSDVQKKDK